VDDDPGVVTTGAPDRGLIIAIDGPSGAGKSTAGRRLAELLGYVFLDTGAMYRALALRALRGGVDLDSGEALADLLSRTFIELAPGGRGVFLDGEDVSDAIRTQEVSTAASRLSVHPPVRRGMVARQQDLGKRGGVVMDGRDIGTAVFPDADVKFYVDADARQRAIRRHEELRERGVDSDIDTIEKELRARDHSDTTRKDSPLVRAEDAVDIDTTGLDAAEVVDRMVAVMREKKRS
jgi:cytidylate kinase